MIRHTRLASRRVSLFLVALLWIGSSDLSGQCVDADDDTRAVVAQAWAEHVEAHKMKSPEAAVEMYTDDIWIIWGDGERRGIAPQEELYRSEYPTVTVLDSTYTIESLEVCGDVAHEVNSNIRTLTIDGTLTTLGGRSFHVWVRQPDDSWKIRRSIVISDGQVER